ncbi:hypothetical protein SYNTR_0006 [Candidatus Syntrophocurvum alkaliphilum]|uniref:YcxB-like C-terminal domain-containing protein n=1 Tax=Candidatus Syntrophocurvum alkaliphilum TaxID=2293317 RepID=A0A6I6DFV1_9FIRM|nr:YcxB family protein [Candidatus Syntrophocurvum alkaliphilum]QGT98599.1 hypothetical protein SYNTR_0006 [Candidatus Syntrophocurvum alkaliphilum]
MTDHRHSEIHIECKGTLTIDDLKSFRFHKTKKFFCTSSLLAFLLVFVVYTLLVIMSPHFSFSVSSALYISLIGAVIIYITGLIALNSYIKKDYYSDKLLQEEFKCIINNEGIDLSSTRNSKSKSFFTWDDFVSAEEYKNLFFLYISHRSAVIIPKRFFYSNEDIKNFQMLINENIPEYKTIK